MRYRRVSAWFRLVSGKGQQLKPGEQTLGLGAERLAIGGEAVAFRLVNRSAQLGVLA
jgi:hypothetical protein